MTAILTKSKSITIAIAGNPNSGKSTLFNHLTGLRQKVANYPGVTVEKKMGLFSKDGVTFHIIDLPGTYGLSPRSEDEKIAAEVLTGRRADVPPVDGVICVVDSTCMERSLYLVQQIKETGLPMILLLNMTDELNKSGSKINVPLLALELGVPVFQISALRGEGLDAIDRFLFELAQKEDAVRPPYSVPANGIHRRRVRAKEICQKTFILGKHPYRFSDRLDRIFLHSVGGPLIFLGVVLFVFQSIFSWAQPFMNGIDFVFAQMAWFTSRVLPNGLFSSFIADGVIAGVGSVVIFLPQILIVFFFIAVLENSGYLARAAMVMDKVMSKVGLQGKSFLPLISSYACAIPGIMAARTIENRRDRLATIFIAPFMTCSARLPVYALLVGAFVPAGSIGGGLIGYKALALFSLYAAGFLAAVVTALILKSSVLKSDPLPFLLDIPPYRRPSLKAILLMMWDRSKIFLRRAGTIILGVNIFLWVLLSFPRSEAATSIEKSYAGRIGHFIEPAIRPLGFNWEIGVGLLAAQAAREVIVSTFTLIYRVNDAANNPNKLQEDIKTRMTPLTAYALLMFFVLAMQCTSTMAVAKRETGGWKIPILMFVYMNGLAYTASLIIYQGGRFFGLQ